MRDDMSYEEKSYLIDRLFHKVIQRAAHHGFSSWDQYTPIPCTTLGPDGKVYFAICILGGVGSKVEERVNGYWPINQEKFEAELREPSKMWYMYLTAMKEMKKERNLN